MLHCIFMAECDNSFLSVKIRIKRFVLLRRCVVVHPLKRDSYTKDRELHIFPFPAL